MHLKTLTLRGFKSFASATTLRFEPGITCVVGPNGSGKSNVVDALSWVMGEQGAKSLRGGKMEDVIFAGTSGRPPLGRAEVSLTIDNTDGALPIDYAEVTISRTMFRSGGSDYAINGSPCRLLDVQELLSDSGIGREMHVIVGQGQLDAVLRATPEERRAFIEEAAGVLKHRKRKEKALRKLEAMQGNLTRLADLTAEIRRQLKPLGRQAEVARRARVVQSDLRDAKARLLADDLVTATRTFEADVADEAAMKARQEGVERELTGVRERLAELQQAADAAAPRLSAAQETWYRLSSLRERVRGTTQLAADRQRLLEEAEPDVRGGSDPEELAAQAAEVREDAAQLGEQAEHARAALAAVVQRREGAERDAAAAEQRLKGLLRAAADRREGLARLSGQVEARRSRLEAGQEQRARAEAGITEAQERADRAEADHAEAAATAEGSQEGTEDLDDAQEAAAAALAEAEQLQRSAQQDERDAERDRASWAARREALGLTLTRKDAAGALLGADGLRGVLGSVSALVQVQAGHENAVAAALGAAADAVALETSDDAVAALDRLRADDAGRATLVIGSAAPHQDGEPAGWPLLPPGSHWALSLLQAPPPLRAALGHLLHRVAVVADLTVARDVVASGTARLAVTPVRDVVGAGVITGGSGAQPSFLEMQAALDEATDSLAAAEGRARAASDALAEAGGRRQEAQARLKEVQTRGRDAQKAHAAVAGRVGQLASTAAAARAEVERLRRQLATTSESLENDREGLAELTERLRVAEETAGDGDDEAPLAAERDRLDALATRARSEETDARLHLRTAEERARALAARAEQLENAARAEREARVRAAAREERRLRQIASARAVLIGARYTNDLLEIALGRAEEWRRAADAERRERERELSEVRTAEQRLAAEQARLVDSVHRDEVARAEQRMRIETLRQRSVEDLGLDPVVLADEYGPHQLVPPSPPAAGEPEPDEPPPSVPYDRAAQEKRLRAAERALALLGTVNPLALEEFAALEERHQFLTKQLEDLKSSRRDLLDIVKEIDERVEQVFTEAFHDTAREFEGVFARLFPGGQGRLILTDPSDMLTTGLDVEARPPGKKVKRLSLLSGGERSLTAVALLVAIFKARPSPFYVMDEVEAALDDTNLGRLIAIFEELRESSQLLVVTHQKRTMEVADALYGVTMRGDGVTTVISQRLRDDRSA